MFSKDRRAALTLNYVTAGNFVWDDHLLKGMAVPEKEARISDHYPLWAEFELDGRLASGARRLGAICDALPRRQRRLSGSRPADAGIGCGRPALRTSAGAAREAGPGDVAHP